MTKKTLNTIVSFLAAVSMTAGMVSATAYAAEDSTVSTDTQVSETTTVSGTCGYGILWSVDNGVLTIGVDKEAYFPECNQKKIGDMYYINKIINLSSNGVTYPWSSYADEVTQIEIEEGITSVYNYAFKDFRNIESVTLPKSCEYVADGAFSESVKEITLLGEDTLIFDNAVGYDTTVYGFKNSCQDFHAIESNSCGKFVRVGVAENPAENIEGKAGDNAEWKYDIETRTLEISGTGAIAELDSTLPYRYIRNIVIDEGITKIDDTFSVYTEWGFISKITLPSTLETVSENAFAGLINAVNTADNKPILEYNGAVETTEPESAAIYGDVDTDGKITIADVVLLQKYCVETAALTEEQVKNADATADGRIDTSDVSAILSYLVGKIDKLPWSYDYIQIDYTK